MSCSFENLLSAAEDRQAAIAEERRALCAENQKRYEEHTALGHRIRDNEKKILELFRQIELPGLLKGLRAGEHVVVRVCDRKNCGTKCFSLWHEQSAFVQEICDVKTGLGVKVEFLTCVVVYENEKGPGETRETAYKACLSSLSDSVCLASGYSHVNIQAVPQDWVESFSRYERDPSHAQEHRFCVVTKQ
jgi:hypothetical protein